ncbi:putative ribonuclease h protein [Nicotiana attenuata]|uniref:Ribonuclease h protein n=1 Tax=Nicotiana attenuata TaxID=49451 RepID=A0A314LET7_NICAT|nr:putative ribonuclease h protein [Nicotiana attenuata]
MAASQHTHPKKVPLNLKWIPQKPNYYKLNTDGATSSETDADEIGGVIRNHLGAWMVGFAGQVPHVHCITTELHALIKGLSLALEMQLIPLEVETDAHEVITLLDTDNSKYTNLICDCRHLLGMLHNLPVRHAYKEQNGIADQLAKLGIRMQDQAMRQIFVKLPLFVSAQLQADQIGATTQRLVSIQDSQQAASHDRKTCFVSNRVANEVVANTVLAIDRIATTSISNNVFSASICTMVHEHQSPVRNF